MCDPQDVDVLINDTNNTQPGRADAITGTGEIGEPGEIGEARDIGRQRTGLSAIARPLLIGSGVVVIDQLTKLWAQSRLEVGPCQPQGTGCIDLVGSLRFRLVYNPGAAFSTGASLGPLIGVLAIMMTAVLLVLAFRTDDKVAALTFGLIAGGAVGNVLDRITRATDGLLSGEVVDFIDLQWWPVFNVADMAVVIGVGIIILRSVWAPRTVQATDSPVDGSAQAQAQAQAQGRGH